MGLKSRWARELQFYDRANFRHNFDTVTNFHFAPEFHKMVLHAKYCIFGQKLSIKILQQPKFWERQFLLSNVAVIHCYNGTFM